jgi:glycosyltransferase involved in cell wall biosynthesis
MFELRNKVLQSVFRVFPFDVKGDVTIKDKDDRLISCIIPTHNRAFELERILTCLSLQDMDKEFFEVIVIEDGCIKETEEIVNKYQKLLNLKLKTNQESLCSVGALRNQGLELSTGKYILFLDDDTLILQRHFLNKLCQRFQEKPDIDCIVIPGEADRCLLKHRYSFFNKYSFGGACVAYIRQTLMKLGGFFNDMFSYEDIELSIRFTVIGSSVYCEEELLYYHPPFYFMSWAKPINNGISFLKILRRYSVPVWILCYMNALRFLPLMLLPSVRHRQWSKISCGFLVAPMLSIFSRKWKDNPAYK